MENWVIIKVNDWKALQRCLSIREAVFINEKNVPKEIEMDEFDQINENCDHFLLTSANEDIGTLRCRIISAEMIKIERFCIKKEFRNKGFGTFFIQYIESFYKKNGMKKIVLNAKYSMNKFYEKLGYQTCSNPFFEANIMHIKMQKEL